MEAENRLEGRRDPIARAFYFTQNQSSQMNSVFPISEGRFICSNPAGFCSQQRRFRCCRQTLLLYVPQWTLLSSDRVCGRWGNCVEWISLHRNPSSPGLWSTLTWPRKGTFPSLRNPPPKFLTGHCGQRAEGEECPEGSRDLPCTPELMQPYQCQLLLLLLISALHLAPISSLQSVIKRW